MTLTFLSIKKVKVMTLTFFFEGESQVMT
jgi:hypothetical protein